MFPSEDSWLAYELSAAQFDARHLSQSICQESIHASLLSKIGSARRGLKAWHRTGAHHDCAFAALKLRGCLPS